MAPRAPGARATRVARSEGSRQKPTPFPSPTRTTTPATRGCRSLRRRLLTPARVLGGSNGRRWRLSGRVGEPLEVPADQRVVAAVNGSVFNCTLGTACGLADLGLERRDVSSDAARRRL